MMFGVWSVMPALAGSSAPCQTANNLVANCGFQTGDFTSWTVSGNTTNPGSNYYGVDTFDALPSSYGAGVYTYGAYMSQDLLGTGATVNLGQSIATVTGAQYQVTFWLDQDTPPATGYTHTFTALWGSTTMLSLTPTVSSPGPNGVWTEYTFTETATSTLTALLFEFENDDSYWSFDDVSVVALQAVPEPPGLLLAGTALLALLLLRRKYAVV
jgi:hypothetical protein